MGLQERYDFDSLVNEAERLVIEEMARQLPRNKGLCTCEECVLDIAAFALNQVRPRYRASLLGSIYARQGDDSAFAKEIEKAVADAIRRIKANPAHD
jgi:competence protein ComFB